MAIGDRQLKILQVIDAGHTTGEAIVDAMNSSPQMLSHYVSQMVEDGYIKAARLYDNELQDFVVVRASLTPDGEAILVEKGLRPAAQSASAQSPLAQSPTAMPAAVSSAPSENQLPTAQSPVLDASSTHANPAALSDPSTTAVDALTTVDAVDSVDASVTNPAGTPAATPIANVQLDANIDYGLVAHSLSTMGRIIGELPPDWRDLAEVYLDDLQNEINIAYRRRPVRVRAYFLALLRMLLPIVAKMAEGETFVQQVRLLSRELKIPVKLPGDE